MRGYLVSRIVERVRLVAEIPLRVRFIRPKRIVREPAMREPVVATPTVLGAGPFVRRIARKRKPLRVAVNQVVACRVEGSLYLVLVEQPLQPVGPLAHLHAV